MAAIAQQVELQALLPVLQDAHKKTPPGPRTEALEKCLAFIGKDDFKAYEPYLLADILPVALDRIDDKPKPAAAALAFATALVEKMSIQAYPAAFPALLAKMTEETKWKAKVGACKVLMAYTTKVEAMDRDLLSASLPDLMPSLIALLYDTKADVAEAAETTLRLVMKGVTNRDLEPFIEDVIKAMKNRDATEETIQRLAGIVFVQTVEGSALSVVVPLMLAGFRQPKAMIKRMCARIVGNMSKLVEEPLGAAPFLSELIPALFDAIDTIADPEARKVATETHANLQKIEAAAQAADIAKAMRKAENLGKWVQDNGGAANPGVADYIGQITASLVKTNTTDKDEFKDELTPYLELCGAGGALDALYDEAQKVVTVVEAGEADDDEEGEDLCDTEFTLAYGTKILLHNARMRLKKGGKYGLLGQNDCGKTTLMRAIADGSVDGFPDASEVKTVFVEADIQGELSHLN